MAEITAKMIIKESEQELANQFERIDEIALFNQEKVLNAFKNNKIPTSIELKLLFFFIKRFLMLLNIKLLLLLIKSYNKFIMHWIINDEDFPVTTLLISNIFSGLL